MILGVFLFIWVFSVLFGFFSYGNNVWATEESCTHEGNTEEENNRLRRLYQLKYLLISWEIGWWWGGRRYSSPPSFPQQASGQIFKDDVNGLCSFPLSAIGQDDDYESRRLFSTHCRDNILDPGGRQGTRLLKKDYPQTDKEILPPIFSFMKRLRWLNLFGLDFLFN